MDDAALVAQVRAGNLDAASDLLSRYQDVAYAVALRLLGQPSDAEDQAQEALVQAYTHLADLKEGESFSGWLRRITVNRCLNTLRRRGQLQFESLDDDEKRTGRTLRNRPDAHEPVPELAVLAMEMRTAVDTALLQMPTDQRVAVVLRDMYDYDVAEIATLQKCGVSAAKMRIARGRALLRRLLLEARVTQESEAK